MLVSSSQIQSGSVATGARQTPALTVGRGLPIESLRGVSIGTVPGKGGSPGFQGVIRSTPRATTPGPPIEA